MQKKLTVDNQEEFDKAIEDRCTNILNEFIILYNQKKDKIYTANTFLANLRREYERLEHHPNFFGAVFQISELERDLDANQSYFDAVKKLLSGKKNAKEIISYLIEYWSTVQAPKKIISYCKDQKRNEEQSDIPYKNSLGYKANSVPRSPDRLEDIFIDNEEIEACINVMQEVDNPIIDGNHKFILGERSKGAVVAWVDVLRLRGKILSVSDTQLAKILNNTFPHLNISDRTFRNIDTSAYRKYKAKLTALIN